MPMSLRLLSTPLKLYWHPGRQDSFSTATRQGEQSAIDAGYIYRGTQNFVYQERNNPPSMRPWGEERVTRVLKLYWHPGRQDNFLTATPEGERDAIAAGYNFVRNEGWVHTIKHSADYEPLKLYWHPGRQDNRLTLPAGEQAAIREGYHFIRIEGYTFML